MNAPEQHTYGTVTDLVAPTREGCVFGGWFADSSFTGPKITSLGAEDYTSDIMLYALWTKDIGEDSSYSVDVIQDQTYTGTALSLIHIYRVMARLSFLNIRRWTLRNFTRQSPKPRKSSRLFRAESMALTLAGA